MQKLPAYQNGDEHARPAAELVEPRRAPREVVALFARRGAQLLAGGARTSEQSLAAVEALCGELARMIHAQQGSARAAVGGVELVLGGDRVGWRGTRCGSSSAERSKSVIERRDEPVGPTRGLLHGRGII